MLRAIYECPKPTIARVQGDVFAGGVGLVAACDMAVSVDTATYCLSEVKLGLIPAKQVQDIRSGKGALDAAHDGVSLGKLYQTHAATLAGKHPFSSQQLDEIITLGERLTRQVTPEHARATDAPVPVQRDESIIGSLLGAGQTFLHRGLGDAISERLTGCEGEGGEECGRHRLPSGRYDVNAAHIYRAQCKQCQHV